MQVSEPSDSQGIEQTVQADCPAAHCPGSLSVLAAGMLQVSPGAGRLQRSSQGRGTHAPAPCLRNFGQAQVSWHGCLDKLKTELSCKGLASIDVSWGLSHL